jgi:putative salt-induced outer membrane protein YdiY
MRPSLVLAAAGLATLLVADVASAAPPPATSEPQPPAGTATKAPASSGSTEIAGQGSFGTVAERDETAGDALEWDLSFGALLSTGNARSTAITGGSTFRVRRSRHQLFATFLGNYGRAAVAGSEPVDTVGNLQGRVRYDLFLADRWSLFGMVTARHDPFQRLDLRLNLDPGVAFYVINDQKEQLQVEAGYDFQLDVRDPETAIEYEADGSPVYDAQGEFVHLPRTRNTHAARLFAGYTNKRNDVVGFSTGLEYLQSLLDAQRWRLNWDTSLSTVLVAKLALAATFTLRLDNDPLDGVKHLDTLSSINLVYRFF